VSHFGSSVFGPKMSSAHVARFKALSRTSRSCTFVSSVGIFLAIPLVRRYRPRMDGVVLVAALFSLSWAIALLALVSRISKYTHDTQAKLERVIAALNKWEP